MNILSIDYGKRNIGLAIANNITYKILFLLILKNSKYFYIFLKKKIFFFSIKLILIGFPCFFKLNSKSYLDIIFLIKKIFIKIINTFHIRIKIINDFFVSFNFDKKSDHLSALYFIKYFFDRR